MTTKKALPTFALGANVEDYDLRLNKAIDAFVNELHLEGVDNIAGKLRALFSTHFPVFDFITLDAQESAVQRVLELMPAAVLTQGIRVPGLVREWFPILGRKIRINIKSIPVTFSANMPTEVRYGNELISFTQIQLEMEDMYYETHTLPNETIFEAYLRATREATAMITQTVFLVRSDIMDHRNAQLGVVNVPFNQQFSGEDL